MSVLRYLRENHPDYNHLDDKTLVDAYLQNYHPGQELEEVDDFYADKREQTRQDEFSSFGAFTRGVERGYQGIVDLFTRGGIRGLYEYAQGDYEEAAKRFEDYQNSQRELNQNLPSVIDYRDLDGEGFLDKMTPSNVKELEDLKDFALGSVGQVVTDVAGGGVAGFAAKTGAKIAAKQSARLLGKKLSKNQLDKVGNIATQLGRTGYFGAQNFGEVYNEVYEATDGDVDMMKVVLHGTINTALDRILPEQILGKLSGQGKQQIIDYAFRRLMKGAGKGALVEGGTEAIQQLSVELAKTDGWNYLENITQVDIENIEAALAQGIFGGAGTRGPIDLATGISPEKIAKREKTADDAILDANLEKIKKGGGLAEPTIPSAPTLQEEVKPERTREEFNIRKKMSKFEKDKFRVDTGETWDSYVARIKESKAQKRNELSAKNKEIRQGNKQAQEQYDKEIKELEDVNKFRGEVGFQVARDYINGRLQNLRDKGDQGLKIADSLENQINKKDVKVSDLVTAFNSADILNEIIPQSADLSVEFLDTIMHESGPAQGIYNSSAKLLALAYDVGDTQGRLSVPDVRNIHEQTASHEGFHVLQDYFGKFDKGAVNILANTFGSQGQSVDYINSPVRKWIKRLNPDMDARLVAFSNRAPKNVSQESGQMEDTSNQGILGSELQAYAFQVYADARRKGKTPVMQSGLARYFNFIYRFLSRMGNALRGYGFRNSQDLFDSVVNGEMARSFRGRGVSTIDPMKASQASSLDAVKKQMEARERRENPVYFKDDQYTQPISKQDTDQQDTRITLGKGQTGVLVPVEKGGPKVNIKMKVGINGYRKDLDGENVGFGYKHIRDMHGFEIEQLGYKQIAPFVRDTLIYGTPKKINTSPTEENTFLFEHKPPNSKQRNVAVKQREGGYWVQTAYVGENTFQNMRSTQATKQDIENYRNSRASALDISPNRISTRIPDIYLKTNEKLGRRLTPKEIQDPEFRKSINMKPDLPEDPLGGDLTIGYDEIMSDPKLVKNLGDFFRNIIHKDLAAKGESLQYNIFTKEQLELPDEQLIEAFIETAKKNVLYIHDSIREEIRAVSKLWYEGANRIVKEIGSAYDISWQRVAGVMAALSPQKDWFQNISLGERAVDIYQNHRDAKVSDDQMTYMLTAIGEKNKPVFNKREYKAEMDYLQKHRPSIRDIEKGGEFNGANPSFLKAMILRSYDETYNEKGHYVVTPDGIKGEVARNDKGEEAKIGWQSFENISKSIDILSASEDNLMQVISIRMGGAHKVRNFFNNIADPNGLMKDVTIDTHAIAIAFLKPLAGKDVEVGHGLNGSGVTGKVRGVPGSGPRGISGTYGLLAEAYRRAANDRNILPREMQSITWEAIREVFSDKFKNDQNKEIINNLWNQYRDGNLSLEEVQRRVIDESIRAGYGFRDPVWASESNYQSSQREGTPNNATELAGIRLRPTDEQRRFIGRRSDGSDPRGVKGGARQSLEDKLLYNTDYNQASALNILITDDYMRDAANNSRKGNTSPNRLFQIGPQRRNSPNAREIRERLFANRELNDGTPVMVRPNLNGILYMEQSPAPQFTQTVHKPDLKANGTPKSDAYSTALGYDKIVAVRSFPDRMGEFHVNQSKRKLVVLKGEKTPFAGSFGQINQISPEEALAIVEKVSAGDGHIVGFNPAKQHLFVDKDGYALHGYNGKAVHYGGKVYVDGELVYWNEKDAPSSIGLSTDVKYKSSQASSLSYASSFDEVFANRKSDTAINKFLHGLKSFTPKAFGRSFITEVIDSFHPIRVVEEDLNERLTGVRKLADGHNSPYKLIEMQGNVAGRREIVLKRGAPVLVNDGEITIQDGTRGYMEIFQELEDSQEYRLFEEYLAARRAQSLGERERFISPDLIRLGLSRENEKFKRLFDDIQKTNKGLVEFLVQTGLISEQERNNLLKYDYVPFYREIQEEFDKRTGKMKEKQEIGPNIVSSVLNNPSARLQKYKGGREPIGGILDNFIRNASVFVDQGMKNVALKKTTDLFRRANIGSDLRVKPKEASKVNFVTYKVGGKSKYYDVEDPLLYASLASLAPRQVSGILGAMETVARYFREFITHQPAFMVANYMRGEMAGFVTVDAKVTPIVDSLKGFMNSLRNSESIEEMKLNSGVGGYTFGDTPRDSAKAFHRDLRLRNRDYTIVNSPQAIVDLTTKMWSGLTKVGEASELAFRDGVYRTLREQGKSKSEAAYEALNVINFNRKGAMRTGLGSTLGALIPLVPFLNARIQGLYRTFDPMITGRQADRKKVILYGTMLTLASLALYSESSEDERYEQEPLHLKLNYHIFYVGDKRYLIPRAFEVGAIFTTLPEFIMEAIKKGEGEELQKVTLMTLLNTFSLNPTPQAIKPIIEVATNYDMFRQSYIDSPFEANYKPSARYGANTSETARMLSEKTEGIFGMSPNQITKLITGYLGSMGTTLLTAFDVAISRGDSSPPRPLGVFGDGVIGLATEATGFGRFVKDETYAGNKFLQNFYETKEDVDQIYNSMMRFRKDGQMDRAREIWKKNKSLIRFRDPLNKINSQLQEVNREIRRIKLHPDMSPQAKKTKLINLINIRNKIGRRFDKMYQRIKDLEK